MTLCSQRRASGKRHTDPMPWQCYGTSTVHANHEANASRCLTWCEPRSGAGWSVGSLSYSGPSTHLGCMVAPLSGSIDSPQQHISTWRWMFVRDTSVRNPSRQNGSRPIGTTVAEKNRPARAGPDGLARWYLQSNNGNAEDICERHLRITSIRGHLVLTTTSIPGRLAGWCTQCCVGTA